MAKRKKMKKGLIKFILLLVFLGLILGTVTYIYQNKGDNTEKVSSEIDKLMSKNKIKKQDYSKTLEYVLLNNIYNEKYLKEYKDIKFNKQSNFEEVLTTFLPKGYSGKEINYIFNLSNKNIEILKEKDYVDITNYYSIKNFDASKINRYNTYKEKENISYEDAVTRVNIKLDLPDYTDTKEVKNADRLLVLVNIIFFF